MGFIQDEDNRFISRMMSEIESTKESVLQNETRRRIFEYIHNNPGAYYNLIRKTLSLPTGQTLHHLEVLVKEGLIRKQRDGRLIRFFVSDFKINSMSILSKKQFQILSLITKFPNISQKEILTRTGICQSTTSWILSDLKKSKFIVQIFTVDELGRGHLVYRVYERLPDSFNNCPFCGHTFDIGGLIDYCPYCNKRLTYIKTD